MTQFKRLYFARCVGQFGDDADLLVREAISEMCEELVDPNAPDFQLRYNKGGMAYCLDEVRRCDAVVFRALPDGNLGAGVAKELLEAQCRGTVILEATIDRDGVPDLTECLPFADVLTIKETRAVTAELKDGATVH